LIPTAFSFMNEKIKLEDWGLIEYSQGLKKQKEYVQNVLEGSGDFLIFCEHPAVLTLGRMTNPESLLYQRKDIEAKGISIREVDRGGDVTLHAPGQLVVYPIFNLYNGPRDLKMYMVKLEQVAVDLLRDFGILAISIPGKRGVFVGTDKIIYIGVGVRKWVTYHGLGINVNTDLSLFDLIKPCGLNVKMTSIQKLTKRTIPMDEVKLKMKELLIKEFNG